MMARPGKKLTALGCEHPFSLHTLLTANKDSKDRTDSIEVESKSAQFNNYQTQAADLSLTSVTEPIPITSTGGTDQQIPLNDNIYSLPSRQAVFTHAVGPVSRSNHYDTDMASRVGGGSGENSSTPQYHNNSHGIHSNSNSRGATNLGSSRPCEPFSSEHLSATERRPVVGERVVEVATAVADSGTTDQYNGLLAAPGPDRPQQFGNDGIGQQQTDGSLDQQRPATVFSGGNPSSVPPPPPLAQHAHHQSYEEDFFQNTSALNQTGDYLEPSGNGLEYDETYNDYYHHRFTYSDPMQDSSGRQEERLYDYSVSNTNTIKAEISNHTFRYLEGAAGPGASGYLVPPPLHPSPAVLLHIKYVMESVCDWMCFTDVVIVTSSDTLRAHRSVLSAHSSFLCYLLSELGEGDDPVLYLPHHTSLYVRMLLQFFYTGEVTRMTQGDIEPLRDICYCLGINSLISRLDEVKLTISFQSIPSYDTQIPHVQTQVKATECSSSLYTALSTPGEERIGHASKPCATPEPMEESAAGQTSCKFQQQKDKPKILPKSSDMDFDCSPTRQYTVVSKMPRDTTLQTSRKCPHCHLKFFKAESYENHLKLHKGELFKCDICGKSISSKYHLAIHKQTHANKKYACNLANCGREFSDPSALRRHHRNVHGEVKHVCIKCNANFGDRSSWKRHMNDHTPAILFTCSLCKKAFKRRSQLKRHRLSVHKTKDSPTGSQVKSEKKEVYDNSANGANTTTDAGQTTTATVTGIGSSAPATCSQCNAVFRKPYDLKVHMRVHTGERPFKCTMCSKSFSRSYNLQLHIRTHTGEKPHACARCGRCFSDVAAFRRHCRTHSGERPYTCNVCGCRFTQASTAYNHLGTCHNKRQSLDLPAPPIVADSATLLRPPESDAKLGLEVT